jgi:hypothetical protein
MKKGVSLENHRRYIAKEDTQKCKRIVELAVSNHGRQEWVYVKKLEVPSCQHLLYQGASTSPGGHAGTLVPIRGYVACP